MSVAFKMNCKSNEPGENPFRKKGENKSGRQKESNKELYLFTNR